MVNAVIRVSNREERVSWCEITLVIQGGGGGRSGLLRRKWVKNGLRSRRILPWRCIRAMMHGVCRIILRSSHRRIDIQRQARQYSAHTKNSGQQAKPRNNATLCATKKRAKLTTITKSTSTNGVWNVSPSCRRRPPTEWRNSPAPKPLNEPTSSNKKRPEAM